MCMERGPLSIFLPFGLLKRDLTARLKLIYNGSKSESLNFISMAIYRWPIHSCNPVLDRRLIADYGSLGGFNTDGL